MECTDHLRHVHGTHGSSSGICLYCSSDKPEHLPCPVRIKESEKACDERGKIFDDIKAIRSLIKSPRLRKTLRVLESAYQSSF